MKKILFLDTDLGGDCDDVGAVALANYFHNHDMAEIIGMTHTTSLPWGPACIDIVNRYYHNQFPIGATSRKNYCVENTNKYAEAMANRFVHGYGDRAAVEDAVSFIRQRLYAQADHSVTFVCIGQLNNASDLLDSEPDAVCPLTGVELVSNKVKEFVVMGGLFKEAGETVLFDGHEYTTEYNVVCDIPSAQNFVRKAPVRVVFSDFKVGYQIHTAGPLLSQGDMRNPITFSYSLFQNKPRESWDLLAVYYAIMGTSDIFRISNSGTVTVLDDGTTVFQENHEGKAHYIRLIKDSTFVENRINHILVGGI